MPGKEEIVAPIENKPIETESVEEPPENEYEGAEEQKPIEATKEPETQAEKPKPQINRPGGSTPSIKDALNSINSKGNPKKDDQDNDSIPDTTISHEEVDAKSISEEELLQCWSKYVEKLKSDSPRIYSALSNQDPILKDNSTTLELSFRNGALQAEFKQNFKIPLLSYLRERLNNQKLEIEEVIIELKDSSQTKHYTDIDKLKHMIEKNPSLLKLKQDFNLDFE